MDALVPSHADPWAAFGPGPHGDGLTDDHFREVVRLVHSLPGRWFVERRVDDFGFVSVLLVQDIEGADGLTFALSRIAREITLDLHLGEHAEPLGASRTVRRAMERVLHAVHDAARDASPEMGARPVTPAVAVAVPTF